MANNTKKKKFVFVGDLDSINLEIIFNSYQILKRTINYILIGNMSEIIKNKKYLKEKINLNEVLDPINFSDYDYKCLNVYNIENISNLKYKNILNQIKISNHLSNHTKYDLITMPINKAIIKKNQRFIGMTEYLGKINKKETIMLMKGENFSIIPFTTHINPKNIYKYLKIKKINFFIKTVLSLINSKNYNLNYKNLYFLCYNPHCGEEGLIGKEDILLKRIITNRFKFINEPISADSAFNKVKKNSLFLSTYHDQSLIPFKILNKRGINLTLGLNYKRISPAHGTAKDKKNMNKSDNSSYLECMKI